MPRLPVFTKQRINTSTTQNSQLCIEALEDRMMLSTVSIFASGATGEESFSVFDGTADQTFDNVSTDGDVFVFETAGLGIDDFLIIEFTNDLYLPEQGIDRNLTVEKIVVDGETFLTTDPAVFAEGVWDPEAGELVGGSGLGSTLHANGSFFFSDFGTASGTTVIIEAEGTTGDELLEVIVDGEVVETLEIKQGVDHYSVTLDHEITAEQLRLSFINDLYQPGVVDRNVIVSDVRLRNFDSETSLSDSNFDTFSTGTYRAEDGVVPGVNRSGGVDILHANGFLEYRATTGTTSITLDDAVAAFAVRNPSVTAPTVSIEAIDDQGRVFRRIANRNPSTNEYVLVRLINGNELDPTFGDNGELRLQQSENSEFFSPDLGADTGLVFDSVGNIGIVFNSVEETGRFGTGRGQFVTQYNFLGTELIVLDVSGNPLTSFGDGGRAFVPYTEGTSVFVQSYQFNDDDQLVVTGRQVSQAFDSRFTGAPTATLLFDSEFTQLS